MDSIDIIPLTKLKKQVDDLKIKRTCISLDSLSIDDKMNINDYEYLVLSGGGIKGIAFTGALETLQKYINLKKIKGYAGPSAGSIVTSLLALGYTTEELKKIMYDIDLILLSSDGLGYVHDGYNLVKKWGMCPGNYVMEMMGKLIAAKTNNPDYTLEDLQKDTGIQLVILGTNYSYKKTEYFYAGNKEPMYSKIPIRVAVRISMSIPYIFEPYLYNDCYFVDGGTLCNFPLTVFDGEYPGDPKAALNLCPPNKKVLGLKLMTDDLSLDYQMTKKKEFTGLVDFSTSFIDMFLIENDRHMMSPSFWDRTIVIVTPNYPINKFDITVKEKDELIEIGRQYTDAFFMGS